MPFLIVRNLHIATVVITFTLFVLRGFWMMAESPRLKARWVRTCRTPTTPCCC
jgi:uncharacterized membrane protein SirB2